VILIMALNAQDERFGDQSATNLALFESRFRIPGARLRVFVLDPLMYPGGGVFFDTQALEEAGVKPVLVRLRSCAK
jgi:hypothetical protein